MRVGILAVVLLGAVLFIFGSIASWFFSLEITPFSLGMGYAADCIVLTLVVFICSLFAYGYFGAFAMLLLGIMSGPLLLVNPVLVYLAALPMLLALYAGNTASLHLREDFEGKGNIREHKFRIFLLLAAALALAAIIGVLGGYVPNLGFFQDLLSGLDIQFLSKSKLY